MTRDEILHMEAGREMDALIAEKVMGWKWHSVPDDEMELLRPDEKYFYGATRGKNGVIVLDGMPHYSTDIAAAWEVVEKLEMSVVDTGSCDPDTRYMAGGFSGMTNFYGYIQGYIADNNNTGFAPTAPLAICRAALLATMEAE